MYVSLPSEYCVLRPIGHGVGSMCVYPALNSLLKLLKFQVRVRVKFRVTAPVLFSMPVQPKKGQSVVFAFFSVFPSAIQPTNQLPVDFRNPLVVVIV